MSDTMNSEPVEDRPSSREGMNRRDFLSGAGRALAAGAIGAGVLQAGCATAPKDYPQAPSSWPRGPRDKIRLGFIGTGGRGRNLMQRFIETEEIEVRAVCDVKTDALDQAHALGGGEKYEEYEGVLDREDIDAVVVATPDHWHAIMTIAACKAGKDVLVEKPLALCVDEGRRMVQAARKYGRVVQMGTQQLSGERYHQARELIQGGRLGKVTIVRVWNLRNAWPGRGKPADSDPPPTINWDRWLGPRPAAPYNPLKASGAFRSFWEYAGGILTDWGVHHFHTILDIMGYDAPRTASAAGGRFAVDDITTVPDTLSVLYQFDDWIMEYMSSETNGRAPYGSEYGIEFCGHDATMFLDRKGFMITSEKDRSEVEVVGEPAKENFLPPALDERHTRNFIECVRSRRPPASEVEAGHKATTLAHLGNISLRVGRQIRWDPVLERIPGDPEADALLRRSYRKPYLLPEV